MQEKSKLWLMFVLTILLPLVGACASTLSTTNTGSVPVVGENLYVLNNYAAGNMNAGQNVIVINPAKGDTGLPMTFPAGLTSQDHQRLYTATTRNGQTTITGFNTQTGATIQTFVIADNYSLNGQSYDNAVISANGRWLALRQNGQTGDNTTIALVDTQKGILRKTIQLSGVFELDAVSPDGSNIFLLEKLNDRPGHYNVRLYQVNEGQLYQYTIVDKTIPNDIMSGTALTRQMASDGSIAYTLYIDTVNNIAFVHILPLNGNFLGARCIDLSVGKSADLLHYYTLALSSDGTTLYAANAALGVVEKISLHGEEVFYDTISSTGHFDAGNVIRSEKMLWLYNAAALSADQKTLYVVGMNGIWAVNADTLQVQNHYLPQQSFTSIALSTHSRILYAVAPAGGINVIDTTTGQSQQIVRSSIHTPWGIEWVSN